MRRFTVLLVDREQEDYKRCVVTAPNSGDCEDLCRSYLFDQEVKQENYTVEEIDPEMIRKIEAILVIDGDHPNLIVSDTEVIDITVPVGWEVPDYYKEAMGL